MGAPGVELHPGEGSARTGGTRARRVAVVALVILLAWLFASAWNLDKAFHIDDTAHLEIAQWIAEHPLRPMSGLVHWESQDESKPIHSTNQPALYFYAMAGWGTLFGWSERSLHLLLAIFALLAIAAMYVLARGVGERSPAALACFLALGPAFVVNQNTMVDVPLLATWLVFYWALLTRDLPSDRSRYAVAAVACSAALLVKYASLLLLPILVVHMVARRRLDLLYLAAVPVLVLLGWSAFNWLDYGGVHLLGRETTSYSADELFVRLRLWLVALGAVSPFAAYFYLHASARLPGRWGPALRVALAALLGCLVALALAFWADAASQHAVERVLRPVFLANGIAFAALAVAAPLLLSRGRLGIRELTLGWWLLSGTAFIVVFAPAIATRHVLLVVPALLLLAERWQREPRVAWTVAALALTVGVTSLVASADRWWAGVYREQAREIRASLPREANVWFTGHWGWQWYAKQNGMTQIDQRWELPRVGDYVVEPRNVSPSTDGGIPLALERCISVPRKRFFEDAAAPDAGFYSSDLDSLPWTLSRDPIEEFCIYRVGAS